ncbi:MFS transporter [Candidatus Woesearchaeota archaeon]|nr:MFS transporter [Candidatus Woesearchaeota archaeon]
MLFKKEELKILWPFYLDALISPMLFFAPAFFVIYFNNLGFNLFQIGLLLAVAPLFRLIFEVPTGAFADLYGRKLSVLLSTILGGIGFLALYFFTDFISLLIIFAFLGFSETFCSGAKEAWITDLIKNKRKELLHTYFVKYQSIDSIGLVVSGFIGALFVKFYGLSVIWLIGALSFIISTFLLSLGEEYFIKRKVKSVYFNLKKQTIEAINYTKNHHVLFYFLIISAILLFAESFSSILSWTPFLKNLGFPNYAFGYLWSALSFIGVVAPLIGSKFYKKNKERKFLTNSLIFSIITTLLIIFANNLIFALLIFVSFGFFDFVKRPVERVYFHRFIPSKLRASVGSVESMFLSLIGIIGYPIGGYLIDLIGPKYTIFLSGIIMIPAVLIYMKIREAKSV